jgi:hypothetical protein
MLINHEFIMQNFGTKEQYRAQVTEYIHARAMPVSLQHSLAELDSRAAQAQTSDYCRRSEV